MPAPLKKQLASSLQDGFVLKRSVFQPCLELYPMEEWDLMMKKNREDIKNYILKIEQQFPVDSWKVNHLAIWPILRIKLFFYLIDVIESEKKPQSKTKKKSTFFQRFKIELKKINSIRYYFFWFRKLPLKKYLFVGADAHRVNFKSKRYIGFKINIFTE